MTKPTQGTIKAIIFDLDGTLIDSAPDLRVTANKILAAAGRRAVTLEEVQGMIGDGMPTLMTRCFRATGGLPAESEIKAHIRAFLEVYTGEDVEPEHLYPGAAETLEALKGAGFTLGLCTNKNYGPTMTILKKLNLAHYFASISGGDSVPGIRKPDPGHLVAVMQAIGIAPAAAVMVGDKIHDVSCAHGAGLKAIAVSFGYASMPMAELGADAVVDSLTEVPGAVARLA
ncbi:MAG: phosphoglycolate phosphatase [Rhodospirillales bacterium]